MHIIFCSEMQAIDAYGVGKVVASGHPDFEKDDLVIGLISWGEYSIVKEGSILNKLNSLGFPYSYHVGILGLLIIYHLSLLICN